MSQKIKTICLVLITLAILSAVGFYCWSVYEQQVYFERDEMFRKNLSVGYVKLLESIERELYPNDKPRPLKRKFPGFGWGLRFS